MECIYTCLAVYIDFDPFHFWYRELYMFLKLISGPELKHSKIFTIYISCNNFTNIQQKFIFYIPLESPGFKDSNGSIIIQFGSLVGKGWLLEVSTPFFINTALSSFLKNFKTLITQSIYNQF